jgi:hypothetical protein
LGQNKIVAAAILTLTPSSAAATLPTLFLVSSGLRRVNGRLAKGLEMKCPRCWSDKAYVRSTSAWQQVLMSCLLLVPMKCRHCYHKFTVFWLFTLGKQVRAPTLRIAPASREAGPSYAARHYAATHRRAATALSGEEGRPQRSKAA